MYASSFTTSPHRYLPTPAASPPRPGTSRAEEVSDRPSSKTDTLPPDYLKLFPNGRPDQVSNAPAPQALRAVPPQAQAASPAEKPSPVPTVVTSASGSNARSGVQGWHRYRSGPEALPKNAPELHHYPSGVLPKKVKEELEQVMVLLEHMNLKAIKACRLAQQAVDKASAKLDALQNIAPAPPAPMEMMVAGALFDDTSNDDTVVQNKAVRRAEKQVRRLENEQLALAEKYQKKLDALNVQKLKLEAKIRAETVKSVEALR